MPFSGQQPGDGHVARPVQQGAGAGFASARRHQLAGDPRFRKRPGRAAKHLVDTGGEQVLLEGVSGPTDDDGTELGAFQLEYVNGSKLVRASFDLTVAADDSAQLAIEGDDVVPIRLVGSTAPRRIVW